MSKENLTTKKSQKDFKDANEVDFGSPDIEKKEILKKEKLTEKDKFNFAKYILLSASIIFLFILIIKIFWIYPGIQEVWDYYSIFFSSIVSLIVGFYFRDRLD